MLWILSRPCRFCLGAVAERIDLLRANGSYYY
jgi:hypothetical protein